MRAALHDGWLVGDDIVRPFFGFYFSSRGILSALVHGEARDFWLLLVFSFFLFIIYFFVFLGTFFFYVFERTLLFVFY